MVGGLDAEGPLRAGPRHLTDLPGRSTRTIAIDALVWLVFLAAVVGTFGTSVDDAFITMRFAANLAHGHGPSFNPGTPVEGFSSPLHLAVLTVAELVPGGGTLLRAKLISVVFAALALGVARQPIRRLPVAPWLSDLALVLVASSSIAAFASVNGLETSLAALLVVLVLRPIVAGTWQLQPWRVGVPAGLLLWTRPEALLLVVAVGAAGLLVTTGDARRSMLRWLAMAGGFGVALVATRLVVFGQLLPNTYAAKHVPIGRALRPGLGYAAVSVVPRATFVPGSVGLLVLDLLLVGVLACFAAGLWWCWRERSLLLVCPAAVLAQVSFAIAAGSDWMPGGRYLAPVVVPAIITLVLGVQHLTAMDLPVGGRRLARWCGAGGAVVLVAAALVPWWLVPRSSAMEARGHFDDRSLFAISTIDPVWLRFPALFRCAGPGDTVATTEIGFAPWVRQDVRVMDLSGLTDRRIAERAPTADHWVIGVFEPDWNDPDAFVVQEVLRRRPAVVVVSSAVDPGSAFARAYRPAPGARYGEVLERAFVRRDHRCRRS